MRYKVIVRTAVLVMLAFTSAACDIFEPEFIPKGQFPIGSKLEDLKLPDLSGTERSFEELKGENGAVLVWVSAECPVVKSYNERINQAAVELREKGINLIGINSNRNESVDWIKSHASEVGYNFPILIDKGNAWADKLEASVTPEFFYFRKDNVLLYHGALDNDRSGKSVTINYLRDAFDSALSNKPVKTSETNVIGCSIKRA